jgi:HEAT repeat protein
MRGRPRWVAIALLAGAAFAEPVAAEEPKPDAKPPPAKEPTESPLEGEAKQRYEAELAKHLKVLKTEKNAEVVRGYVAQLGAKWSRAGRDALIAYARGNKNQEAVKNAFDALAKLVDGKATWFLCGKDGVRSNDFLVQQSAVQALGEARNPKAVEPMLEVMKDPAVKIEVQGAVCLALAKTSPADPRVAEQVFRCADDKRDTVRANAVEALGHLASKEAFPRLLDALANDKNTRVRGAAATGLGWTGRKDAIPALEKAVAEDKSLTVRSAASNSIAKIAGGK